MLEVVNVREEEVPEREDPAQHVHGREEDIDPRECEQHRRYIV
jgi:hypothetical protein